MKKSIFFAVIPSLFLFSCSVLTESQLKNISTFAVTAKNYSNFPGKAVRKSQQLQYNNNVLEASALSDSVQIMRALSIAKSQYDKGIVFSKKMDLSLGLIQKYAALLEQLSSDNYTDDLGKSARDLSGDLDDAVKLFNDQLSTKIPDYVGKGISQLITLIGGRVIKNKQAKALQKFIPTGDTLIQLTMLNLVSALDDDLKQLIENYRMTFQSDFKTNIFDHSDKINYNILQFYIKTNSDYETVELLRRRCIHSAQKMASAHKELKDNIMRKKNLEELLSQTKAFVSDVKDLYEIMDKLSGNA